MKVFERDVWPAENDQGEMTNVDARTYLAGWVADRVRQSDEFRFAIEVLESAGCDRLKLAWLLCALAGAQHWESISRECLQDGAKDLECAAHAVRRLFFSQLNPFLGLDTLKLEGELHELARRASELEPDTHKRRPMWRDSVRAGLVRYVQRTTGHYHDDEVAALIGVVESLHEAAPAGETTYTMEAHVQWRQRASCQNFLGDSPVAAKQLDALEADMEQELRGV